jgi:cardiolipin synthase
MTEHPEWIAYLIFITDLTIRIGLSLRILMRGNTVGVTFAWMTIVLALPYLGALLYLLIGEHRLGSHRIDRAKAVIDQSKEWRNTLCEEFPIDSPVLHDRIRPLNVQARKVIGYPTLPGNRLTVLDDFETIFRCLIDDVSQTNSSIPSSRHTHVVLSSGSCWIQSVVPRF